MMKRSIFGPVKLFSGLLFVMLMTLVGCNAPTDHVGEWTAIEKDGKEKILLSRNTVAVENRLPYFVFSKNQLSKYYQQSAFV